MCIRFFIIFIFLSKNIVFASPQYNPKEAEVLAPGWSESIGYKIPEPGAYDLYNIDNAADGNILIESGDNASLHSIMGDKITLLSFIYSTCTDINGCPLATAVFYKIKEKLANNKDLLGKIRLISLSFDPLFDTPQVMKLYGKDLLSEDVDWRFLTTRSYRELNPIMKNYQQPVIRKYSENGEYQGVDAHILRVFLIDKNKVIRNIYSVSFLHPDLLINDIKTLLIEGK
tara:strand:- start:98 stop:784 length:687 start_codon:yes stop_codon:yes gene_type:complete